MRRLREPMPGECSPRGAGGRPHQIRATNDRVLPLPRVTKPGYGVDSGQTSHGELSSLPVAACPDFTRLAARK